MLTVYALSLNLGCEFAEQGDCIGNTKNRFILSIVRIDFHVGFFYPTSLAR